MKRVKDILRTSIICIATIIVIFFLISNTNNTYHEVSQREFDQYNKESIFEAYPLCWELKTQICNKIGKLPEKTFIALRENDSSLWFYFFVDEKYYCIQFDEFLARMVKNYPDSCDVLVRFVVIVGDKIIHKDKAEITKAILKQDLVLMEHKWVEIDYDELDENGLKIRAFDQNWYFYGKNDKYYLSME